MIESVRDLTAATASGDTEAFARLYRGWFDRVFAMARRATGRDEAFCLDVVQDTMMRVIRSIRPMDTDEELAAWLSTVARSCAYDRLRAESRRRRRERSAARGREVTDDDHELAHRLHWLRRELAGLDLEKQRLLVLRHKLGWTLERIGQVVGLRPGAVDGRLSRTVDSLREKAEEQNG